MKKYLFLLLFAITASSGTTFAIEGALNGLFTINANGDQIQFSKSNLKYKGSAFQFTDNQWDNMNTIYYTSLSPSTLDEFAWGTGDRPSYLFGESYTYFKDWGRNAIINGGNEPNVWRTLTKNEWVYLFHERDNGDTLFGLGSVNNVNGVILLPDNWTDPQPDGKAFVASTTKELTWNSSKNYYENSKHNNYSHNIYTAEQWTIMEQAGAVFLPAAGALISSTNPDDTNAHYVACNTQDNEAGYYWSATREPGDVESTKNSYFLLFSKDYLVPQKTGNRSVGFSVRLVYPINRNCIITWLNSDSTLIDQTIVEMGSIPTHENPTKLATAEYTYTFAGWEPEIMPADGDATYIATYDSTRICPMVSGYCGGEGDGTNLTWELSCDSVLTILGSGTMMDYSTPQYAPWYDYRIAINEVSMSDGVANIGNYAFSGCRNLKSLEIPNSVTSIGVNAFDICESLTNIIIPNRVTSIGDYAFQGCSGLTTITIPSSAISIGDGILNGCSALTSIMVANGNIVYDSRDNCNAIIETASNTLIAGCQNTIIPNDVIRIGEEAFNGCTGLTSIVIPNSVTNIGAIAFELCTNLTSVTIGSGVTQIEESAFADCNSLTSIYSYAITPPIISSYTFEGVTLSSCTLHVPCGCLDAYQAADVWKNFGTIVEEGCKHEITWLNYDRTILKVDSLLEGETPSYSGETPVKPVTVEYTYTFAGWTPEIVPVTEDATYTAVFDSAKVEYHVDVTIPDTIENNGTVIIGGTPTYGDTITLTAIPDDGYYFDSWSDGNTDNPRVIVVTGDVEVYPIFKPCEPITTNITATIYDDGSYRVGDEVFTTRGTYRVTLSAANGCDSVVVLRLNVIKLPTYNVRVEVNNESYGSASGAGIYKKNQEATLTATPKSKGNRFTWWYNSATQEKVTANPYTFTVTEDVLWRAVFSRAVKTITIEYRSAPRRMMVDADETYAVVSVSEKLAEINNISGEIYYLYDASGKLITSSQDDKQYTLPSGMYIIRIEDQTEKFIVP